MRPTAAAIAGSPNPYRNTRSFPDDVIFVPGRDRMTANLSPAALAQTLIDMERELTGEDRVPSVAQSVVAAARAIVPGAEQAGITTRRSDRFVTLAATDPLVDRTDEIMYRFGSGPGVAAAREERLVNCADVRVDGRWSQFGAEAAVTTGVISMLSFRMSIDNEVDASAALNLYSAEVDAFDDASEAIGLLIATQGALGIARAAAHEKVDNLLIALKTSREIGMAMGVLMQSLKLGKDEAFDLLRIVSQRTHRKLADIAVEVADTGALPPMAAKRPSRRHPE